MYIVYMALLFFISRFPSCSSMGQRHTRTYCSYSTVYLGHGTDTHAAGRWGGMGWGGDGWDVTQHFIIIPKYAPYDAADTPRIEFDSTNDHDDIIIVFVYIYIMGDSC